MKTFRMLLLALSVIACLPAPLFAGDPSIQGTYQLESRDLPDGKKQMPPAVTGLLTYTKEYRNFNVSWMDPGGKHISIAYTAKYRLTPTVYQETPIYWMTNNLGGEGVSYKMPANKGAENAVSVKDGTITFPVAGEPPVLVFTADGITATAKDAHGKLMFVDHWKKVE
jgi:hypothetical protein